MTEKIAQTLTQIVLGVRFRGYLRLAGGFLVGHGVTQTASDQFELLMFEVATGLLVFGIGQALSKIEHKVTGNLLAEVKAKTDGLLNKSLDFESRSVLTNISQKIELSPKQR